MSESDRTASVDIPPPVAMLQLIAGFWVSRAIYIAAKLGIADLLKDGPKNSEELAQATGMHALSLHRAPWRVSGCLLKMSTGALP